jgi:uncharacterized protein YukE
MGDKTVLDYQQLDNISKRFQQEADELNGVLSQTRGQVENLHGTGWEAAARTSSSRIWNSRSSRLWAV